MTTNRKTILTLIAACGVCIGSLGAGPVEAYPLCPTPNVALVPITAPTPEVTAALQTLDAARNESDTVQSQVLAGVHESPEYQQALGKLNADQEQMDNAKAATPYSQDQVSALAITILADENRLTGLEQPTLNASPDYRVADANVQAATQSFQYVQQVSAQQQQLANAVNYREQLEVEHAEHYGYRGRLDRQPQYGHEGRFVSQNWTAFRGR